MEYEQDSVLLGNWNKNDKVAGHSIAGIKCKGDKFVYNGWTRSTLDNHINDKMKLFCYWTKFCMQQKITKFFAN